VWVVVLGWRGRRFDHNDNRTDEHDYDDRTDDDDHDASDHDDDMDHDHHRSATHFDFFIHIDDHHLDDDIDHDHDDIDHHNHLDDHHDHCFGRLPDHHVAPDDDDHHGPDDHDEHGRAGCPACGDRGRPGPGCGRGLRLRGGWRPRRSAGLTRGGLHRPGCAGTQLLPARLHVPGAAGGPVCCKAATRGNRRGG